MRTVPLRGKKAAGRVALVDDGDYALVMQYKWYVWELPPNPEKRSGRRARGPYATTTIWENGRSRQLRMHRLITGKTWIDHMDHNGLNNQRWNLRPATSAQNNHNARPIPGGTSRYKGVHWMRKERRWCAAIRQGGLRHQLGTFISELQAAYAYDAAARVRFGEFACTNFPEGPTQAMRVQWEAERAARRTSANRQRGRSIAASWERRGSTARFCEDCGAEYQSKAHNSRYCSTRCRRRADYFRNKEGRSDLKGVLF